MYKVESYASQQQLKAAEQSKHSARPSASPRIEESRGANQSKPSVSPRFEDPVKKPIKSSEEDEFGRDVSETEKMKGELDAMESIEISQSKKSLDGF
jgi:hypothetical protein